MLLAVACTNVAHFQLERVLQRESAERAPRGPRREPRAGGAPVRARGPSSRGRGWPPGHRAGPRRAAFRAVLLLPRDLPRVASAQVDIRSLAAGVRARPARRELRRGSWPASEPRVTTSRRRCAAGHRLLAALRFACARCCSRARLRWRWSSWLSPLFSRRAWTACPSVQTGFAQGELLVVELRHGTDRYRERASSSASTTTCCRERRPCPGSRRSGASYDPPLRSNWYQGFAVVDAPEAPPGQDPGALFRTVTPGYFAARRRGDLGGARASRDADDVGSAGAVIVNRALARRDFGGVSPLAGRFP